MKPPSRLRSAPARYNLGPTTRVWTDREKRRLLQALRAQAQTPGPLRSELLKKYLPSRNEDEILAFVDQLKERVAREAVKAQYRYRQCKQKDAPIPAPIEVWIRLAEKLTGCLEEAVTAAFSQVLTIASAEPLCLLHSVPPKPVELKTAQCMSPTIPSKNMKSNIESEEATISSDVEQLTPAENELRVDFEKIYKYLSVISRGSKAPELPPGESAVLLDLLLSLSEELSHLDYKKLKGHMHKCYMDLSAHSTNEKSRMKAEISQLVNHNEDLHETYDVPSARNSFSQHQEDISSSASSTSGTTSASSTDWKTLGICPLNSFWFPLDILAQKRESLD
ncbi:snRNA-activating protein complex subunit 2 [Python bivittatus]|uniref:snRNA-activating protein complex subunit 2 n=1 Tax=Python bivittatus TaxID=176946 RepID=A0A9F2WG26_PYTBI|nr:snRNA-activating protein complex subunit 2 [Python bivittatus]